MIDRICLALDVPDAESAIALVKKTWHYVGIYKVGLELFAAEGPKLVEDIRLMGVQVFLDLKLHDIPTTMERATRAIGELGVSFTTVHSSAGRDAMLACRRVADEFHRSKPGPHSLRLLAVTVLTSEKKDRGTGIRIESRVRDALQAGVNGFVCSAQDIRHVRDVVPRVARQLGWLSSSSFVVTPGIRPAAADTDDQRRVTTPREAIEAGSDMLVVGRPIRDAPDPGEAARAIYEEIES